MHRDETSHVSPVYSCCCEQMWEIFIIKRPLWGCAGCTMKVRRIDTLHSHPALSVLWGLQLNNTVHWTGLSEALSYLSGVAVAQRKLVKAREQGGSHSQNLGVELGGSGHGRGPREENHSLCCLRIETQLLSQRCGAELERKPWFSLWQNLQLHFQQQDFSLGEPWEALTGGTRA